MVTTIDYNDISKYHQKRDYSIKQTDKKYIRNQKKKKTKHNKTTQNKTKTYIKKKIEQ